MLPSDTSFFRSVDYGCSPGILIKILGLLQTHIYWAFWILAHWRHHGNSKHHKTRGVDKWLSVGLTGKAMFCSEINLFRGKIGLWGPRNTTYTTAFVCWSIWQISGMLVPWMILLNYIVQSCCKFSIAGLFLEEKLCKISN